MQDAVNKQLVPRKPLFVVRFSTACTAALSTARRPSHPGDRVDVDLLKDGRMQVRRKHGRSVTSIFGMLKRQATPARSIEELNEAAAAGWAGEV